MVSALPTIQDIRDRSNVEWAEYGYPEPAVEGDTDRLGYVLEESVAEFESLMGIDPAEIAVAEPPDPRSPLIHKAIRMLVEFNAGASQGEMLASVVDFDVIQSFSAGGYSETKRDYRAVQGIIHPWPQLNRLLTDILEFEDGAAAAQRAGDTPEVWRPGVEPRPGEWIIDDEIPLGGIFAAPILPGSHLTFGPGP